MKIEKLQEKEYGERTVVDRDGFEGRIGTDKDFDLEDAIKKINEIIEVINKHII